ncbi:hypothetical protein JW935_16605 [candidate division KSB1 bacterium]|nr:hypothetical protein [candidate division KSB1 bacterium]
MISKTLYHWIGVLFFVLFAFFQIDNVHGQFDQIEMVHHLGGGVDNLAVEGDYAYVVQRNILTVLDISTETFEQVAFVVLSGQRNRIHVNGDYAYTGFNNTVDIVNISDPSNPALVSTTAFGPESDVIQNMSSNDGLLCLAQYNEGANSGSFRVVNVSDPSAPVPTDRIDIVTLDCFVAGNKVYAITGHETSGKAPAYLRIYDISNPSSVNELGHIQVQLIEKIFVAGNYAYVGGTARMGLTVLNISNPANLQIVADKIGLTSLRNIKVVDQTLFATGASNLVIYNVKNPKTPSEIANRFLETAIINGLDITLKKCQTIFRPRRSKGHAENYRCFNTCLTKCP